MACFPFSEATHELIRLALLEDLIGGDVTADAIFGDDDLTGGAWVAKRPCVLAGQSVVEEVFRRVDADVRIVWTARDGDQVSGEFGRIEGRTRSLLRAERVALNFIRHLSGVATQTRAWVDLLGGSRTMLVDTRKTTPGFREIEKYAVRMGGGHNHRYNLSGGAMIKDNHIAAAGSIAEAVARVRAHAPFLLRVEVEVTSLDQLDQALAAGADAVLLDNMDTETMRVAAARVAGRAIVEASGNITGARLAELGDIGLDVISSGALTHSAPNADISLELGA
jgi:nicotinate-nucleotide pyrophosphorylase (carboxylating)